MRKLAGLLAILFLLPVLVGWPSSSLGGGGTGGGTGGGGGGSACSAPNDFVNGSPAAAHLYFYSDSSWASAGDPDDEANGTDLTLSASTNLTEAGDISSADLPTGSFGSAVAIDLDGSTENAYAVPGSANWSVNANNGDHTAAFWVKASSLSTTDDLFAYAHGSSDDGWVAIASDGHVQYATADDSVHLNSGTGVITANNWHFVTVVTDNDGAANGNDSRTIYVDGVAVAGPTNDIDNAAATPNGAYVLGFKPAGVTYKIHGLTLFHSALTQSEVQELGCCGINGDANPSQREDIIGGSGGTTCAGF